MRKLVSLLVIALLTMPAHLHAEALHNQSLFHVERNKNANIVQYDFQIDADGRLLRKEPVVAYWIRLAEDGQIEELSWAQKTFAYGFKAKYDHSKDSVEMKMKFDKDRAISVSRNGESYCAVTRIDGSSAFIRKIFVFASGKGLNTKLDYIELYGYDETTGEERYEKFTP